MEVISRPTILLMSAAPENVDFAAVNAWWEQQTKSMRPQPLLPPVVSLFKEECAAMGLNWLALFCQFVLETGYGSSVLFKTKLNMFGLGAIDSNPIGNASPFRTYRDAVRAGAQHLAVYAGSPRVKGLPPESFVLARTKSLMEWGYFGLVKSVDQLGGKAADGKVLWASDAEYGAKLQKLYWSIVDFSLSHNPKPAPVEPPKVVPPAPAPAPVPAPAPKPEEPKPVPAPAPAPAKKFKLPLWASIALKAALKYGTPFVLGVIGSVAEPWATILKGAWEAVKHLLSVL